MPDEKTPTNGDHKAVSNATPRPKCGIIMPISEIDGLSEAHWADVLNIFSDAIQSVGFEPNLVSTTEEVGIIQKTIIQNLYDNPMVVCDVSGKNPNVMFELGMRLAFDRPTVVVKDDKTSYTFDTASIQHLGYPRDLRFNQIVDFKAKLSSRVKNTHVRASTDPEYTTFLKHFGEFKVAKIEKTEVSGQEFIIEELQGLKHIVSRLERSVRPSIPLIKPTTAPSIISIIDGVALWDRNSDFRHHLQSLEGLDMEKIGSVLRLSVPSFASDEWKRELVNFIHQARLDRDSILSRERVEDSPL